MSTTTTVTKTSEQIAADFAAAFRDVKPDRSAADAERLAPYRAEISRLRRRGLSWKQIAEGMRRPPISVPVTEPLLKSIFGPAQKPASTSKPDPALDPAAVPAPAPAPASAPVKPVRPHVAIDPATGKIIRLN